MTTSLGGYAGVVLHVDLSMRAVSEYPWTDADRRRFLGGKVMAARILYDLLAPKTDPLGPENTMVIATGPLNGTGAPSTARFDVSALSPLTGTLGTSNSGGSFGVYLKKAGVDALVITGCADAPVWLEVAEDGVHFRDAAALWGLRTSAAQAALRDAVGRKCGTIVAGPAGENLVPYAALVSDERVAGRTGMGAVFGSKNLKGIAAHGERRATPAHPEAFHAHVKKWTASLKAHPIAGDRLPTYGTAGFLGTMNELGILGTRNFQAGSFEGADAISGETLAETRLVSRTGCLSCPIRCGRVVELDGERVKGPELETLVLLGSNLGVSDLGRIIEWNRELDELGLDTMTTGVTLSLAMELTERGAWDAGVRFGKAEGLFELFGDIAYKRGVGATLATGSRAIARRYGALDIAMQSKGLELAAYEPRNAIGHGLGYAVSNRGACHLNGGYGVALEGLALKMNGRSQRGKHALVAMFQDLMEAVSAAGGCLFTTLGVLPAPLVTGANGPLGKVANAVLGSAGGVLRALRVVPPVALGIPMPLVPHIRAAELATGMKLGFGGFWAIGERGYTLERLIGMRFGITAEDDVLPTRLTTEPIDPRDPASVVPIEPMKRRYYAHRGWDAFGCPRPGLLRRLGLANLDGEA
ncbi:MAG: aldehyde:ferredoxin oxidoreductase [Actinobacteria bacterium]|nr:MAG: aldehyde:ferredoxin oxidoreductase [Actinomycetota bacterium]